MFLCLKSWHSSLRSELSHINLYKVSDQIQERGAYLPALRSVALMTMARGSVMMVVVVVVMMIVMMAIVEGGILLKRKKLQNTNVKNDATPSSRLRWVTAKEAPPILSACSSTWDGVHGKDVYCFKQPIADDIVSFFRKEKIETIAEFGEFGFYSFYYRSLFEFGEVTAFHTGTNTPPPPGMTPLTQLHHIPSPDCIHVHDTVYLHRYAYVATKCIIITSPRASIAIPPLEFQKYTNETLRVGVKIFIRKPKPPTKTTNTNTIPTHTYTPRTPPSLHLYLMTYNDEELLPWVIQYYQRSLSNFSFTIVDNESTDRTPQMARELGGSVKIFHSNGMEEAKKMNARNTMWKESQSDWVIVADSDEVLQICDRMLIALELENANVAKSTITYHMIDGKDPDVISDIRTGVRDTSGRWFKSLLFKPKDIKDMGYSPGSHRSNPVPKDGTSIRHTTYPILLYHYKYFLKKRFERGHLARGARLSEDNLKHQWGIQYLKPPQNLWSHMLRRSKPIVYTSKVCSSIFEMKNWNIPK